MPTKEMYQKHNNYYKTYRDTHKKESREYYHSWYEENGRVRAPDYSEIIYEWRAEHPDRVKAYDRVKYALKSGEISKPKLCENCHKERRLSAHHNDYNQPLKIEWLCSSCHKVKHNGALDKTADNIYNP